MKQPPPDAVESSVAQTEKGHPDPLIAANYSATEGSSSKHPADWGRAMAVALSRLLDQARMDGHDIERNNLFGADLHLTIAEAEDGVQITLRWRLEESGRSVPKPAAEDQHP